MTTWRLGPYRAVGHRFVVVGQGAPVVRDRLVHALEPLSDASPGDDEPITYEVTDGGAGVSSRYRVTADGRPLVRTDSTATAAGHVVWHVNLALVKADRGEHLILHAGGVQRRGVTVLLPAPMESGKTTTTAGLLRAGFGYLTDEALVLDRETWQVTPYPKALSLDKRSVDVVGDVAVPPYPHADGDSQWQVPWWSLGGPGVPARARPDLVVFPAYRAGATTELRAVSPGESLVLLATSTFEFTRRPRRNLDVLAALAEALPAYQLTVGDLSAAVGLVADLVDDLLAARVHGSLQPQRRTA